MKAYCDALHEACAEVLPAPMAAALDELARERLVRHPHGDQDKWLSALAALPAGPATLLPGDTVTVAGVAPNLPALRANLQTLMPWRKGPFQLFDCTIDTEWRSDWKWQRVLPHLSPLAGRRVLDVGCGSGYHCWRMWEAGARWVLGIDPTLLFLMQFLALKRYAPTAPVWLAPVRMEELPPASACFDTVFSMGVLYHRRSPLDHLLELRDALVPGGELVLETLVVEGDDQQMLMPEDRYAQMRNVYFLPSVPLLERWLRRSGFTDVRTVDVNQTSLEEQRASDWMQFQSLADFLDPADPQRTCEGYPAPRRATLVARKP
ncbi:tRNA 5-methoxyuridine(34)/uridine 5-oxyacetic acid(34) synthase CmoB [Isoalcanivorax beigongshangi]|uniref:tRNA U34 carboxymethyltransferase n=1 Tax=Isoalcanivorax beigongshangi TaxID=3238810 RepID=A0ABV4AFW6_9GAMM